MGLRPRAGTDYINNNNNNRRPAESEFSKTVLSRDRIRLKGSCENNNNKKKNTGVNKRPENALIIPRDFGVVTVERDFFFSPGGGGVREKPTSRSVERNRAPRGRTVTGPLPTLSINLPLTRSVDCFLLFFDLHLCLALYYNDIITSKL